MFPGLFVVALMAELLRNVNSVVDIPRVEFDGLLETPDSFDVIAQHQMGVPTIVPRLDLLLILLETFGIGEYCLMEVVDDRVGITQIIPAVGVVIFLLE